MRARAAMLGRAGTLLVASLAAMTCGERVREPDDVTAAGRLARAACGWIVGCGCDTFADDAACHDRLSELLELEHASAIEAGLVLDEACLASMEESWDAGACEPTSDPDPASCADRCALFHGDIGRGESCRWHGNFHDCRRGLSCERHFDGVDRCSPPCGLTEGEPCRLSAAFNCDPTMNLTCSEIEPTTGVGSCVGPSGFGESCEQVGCILEAFCDFDAEHGPTCQPTKALGAPCELGECGWDVRCDTAADPPVCTAPPVLGEPCPNGWCAPGSHCDVEAPEPVCIPRKAAGEPCVYPEACESLVCSDDRCAAPDTEPSICKYARGLPPRI